MDNKNFSPAWFVIVDDYLIKVGAVRNIVINIIFSIPEFIMFPVWFTNTVLNNCPYKIHSEIKDSYCYFCSAAFSGGVVNSQCLIIRRKRIRVCIYFCNRFNRLRRMKYRPVAAERGESIINCFYQPVNTSQKYSISVRTC